MHSGQKQFYDYILKRVQSGNEEKAKKLLKESFEKQENGTFDQEYLQSFMIEMYGMIQDEDKEEVEMIMNEFGKKIK
ncbi:hypothetical protein [Thomasclavelia sp.]